MDSTINWGSLERARRRQMSPSWSSRQPLGSAVALSNVDQSFDFSGFTKARNSELFAAQSSDHNGLSQESQLNNHIMLSSIRSTVPTQSASEAFGHWKPVYDEKSKPAFSLTGTEIWASHMPDVAQKNRNEEEFASSYSRHGSLKDRESVFGNLNGVSDVRWGGGKSSGGSDAEFVSRLVNPDIGQGWGRTPVCQEKPWDLCQDTAILETGAVLPPAGLQDELNATELDQESSLLLLKSVLSSGEPLGVLGSNQLRPFERLSRDDAPKSYGVDSTRLMLELQKLGAVEAAAQNEFNPSRRGSSVSSIDGISHSGIFGRKDCGFEPQGNVPLWIDKQRHKDESSVGSTTRMSSGMQSPSGWSHVSGSEKASVIDDGTSVWGKQPVSEKSTAVEEALSWSKLLKVKTEFSPPVSAFNIDVSIPPPPPALNAHMALLPGVQPVHSSSSLLRNFPARQTNAALPIMTARGGQSSISPDFPERQCLPPGLQQYNQLQHLGQKTWIGSQCSNMDTWSSMQRKNIGISQNKAPQTRSKLIQQLVSMGFKKEDVQNALITNNMDLDKAFAELIVKHRTMLAQGENSAHRMGRSQQVLSGPRELMHHSLSDHPFGMTRFSNDSVANALDLTKLLSNQRDWDSHLSNTVPMVSPAVNPPFMPHPPAPSPQSIYSSHRPPGLGQNIAHTDPLATGSGNFSHGLSDLVLWQKLIENGQNSFPPLDPELLKIFGHQISSSDSQKKLENNAAVMRPNSDSLQNVGFVGENIGVVPAQNSFLAINPPLSGSMYSSAVDPKGLSTQKSLNFDRFESRPASLASRQLSVNVIAAPDNDASVTGKDLTRPGSLNSSPGVASAKLSLPSALEIKEFIPGVPWKGAPVDTSKQEEVSTVTEPSSKSPAMVFKDMVKCLANGKVEASQEVSVPEYLPSSWVRLRNVSDELDDDALQALCATYGEVKVFRDEDNSVLLSYVNQCDAVKAQLALHNSQLRDKRLMAELVDNWTSLDNCGAKTSAETLQESLGYMTLGGLWIPPNSDAALPYYDVGDKWFGETEGEWREGESLESFVPPACEEPGDGTGPQATLSDEDHTI